MKIHRFDFLAPQRRSAATGALAARRYVLFALSVALLGGCATVTFKRGASPDAMAADERACRSPGKDEAAFVACMRERGWFVTGRSGTTAAKSQVTEPQTPPATPGVAAPSAAARPAPEAVAAPSPAAAAPAAAAAADPLARVDVASWWKLGGSAADLDRAIDACVAELGAAHRPDPGATVVTAGLRACLRTAGWYAFGQSGAQ